MRVKSTWLLGAVAMSLLAGGNALAQDVAPTSATVAPVGDTDVKKQVATAKASEDAGDFSKGVGLWLPLAQRGVAEAQAHLGMMYFNGLEGGVCEDDTEAVEWLTKAANQGFAEAYRDLGQIYDTDRSALHDPAKALAWYQKGADQGDARSEEKLTGIFWQGKGVSKDRAKAEYWLEKAASQGDPKSFYNIIDAYTLGGDYSKGEDIPRNDKKAAYWYLKAANQGFPNAEVDLAAWYEKRSNYVEAYKWYALVVTYDDNLRAITRTTSGIATANATHQADASSRDRVLSKLTPAQRAKADRWIATANIPVFSVPPPRPVSMPPHPQCP